MSYYYRTLTRKDHFTAFEIGKLTSYYEPCGIWIDIWIKTQSDSVDDYPLITEMPDGVRLVYTEKARNIFIEYYKESHSYNEERMKGFNLAISEQAGLYAFKTIQGAFNYADLNTRVESKFVVYTGEEIGVGSEYNSVLLKAESIKLISGDTPLTKKELLMWHQRHS